jgi:hypothetical protein
MAGFFTQDLMQSYPWLARIQQKAEQRKAAAQQGSQQAQPTARARQGTAPYAQTDIQARQAEAAHAMGALTDGGVRAPAPDNGMRFGHMGDKAMPLGFEWSPAMMDASAGGFSPNIDGSVGRQALGLPMYQHEKARNDLTPLGQYYQDLNLRNRQAEDAASRRNPFMSGDAREEMVSEERRKLQGEAEAKVRQGWAADTAYQDYKAQRDPSNAVARRDVDPMDNRVWKTDPVAVIAQEVANPLSPWGDPWDVNAWGQ